jgi:c-di-GMP-binding flagellar brake protein YcgR
MSTHAIAWFDEDILGINDVEQATSGARCERRWERTKIDVRIRVTYSLGQDTERIDGQGHDVSGGGIGTYLPADLNVDDNVVVELVRRYGQARISFAAKVSNRNGFRYGLEFVGVEEEQRDALMTAITGTATN